MSRWLCACLVMVTLVTGGCGAPTAPTPQPGTTPTAPAVPVLSGTLPGVWRGYLRADECASVTCVTRPSVPFVVRIAASGSEFVASFEILGTGTSGVTGLEAVVDARGISQADGSVLFTGHRAPRESEQAAVDVRLVVRPDMASGLAGTIDFRKSYTNGGHNRSLIGVVASATYQPLTASSASGSWSGVALVRACQGSCSGSRNVGQELRLDLVLGQSGAAVTGQMESWNAFPCSNCWIPVSGTASPSALTLSGGPYSAPDVASLVLQLRDWSATFDPLGRLGGQFVLSWGPTASSPSVRMECEILWLTRD